jgi:ribosome-binding ATPase YchF (GTP1/OBG family)
LGVSEPAFGRVIHAAFSLLDRISFFTVGEDEGKARVIAKGTKAPKAAGAIYSILHSS